MTKDTLEYSCREESCFDIVITARVRSTTGRYCFHRCLSVHRGGGVRSVQPGGGQVSPAGGGGVRSVQPGGGGQSALGWVRSVAGGGQVSSQGVGQVSGGGGGVSQDRTTEGLLTTRRAVCLLRSRRRTFLLML